MCPPYYLSNEQLSFLTEFFHRLYSLPGGEQPDRELRFCLAHLLRDYPASLANPLASLRAFLDECRRVNHKWLYHGDLEMDFLRLLGQVKKAAEQKPVEVEIDFRV